MNAFLIERLAKELKDVLVGGRLIEAFTTSKTDLFLVFESYVLKVSFFQGHAFIQKPEYDKLPKRNKLSVYKSAVGQKIERFAIYKFDRRFDIVLENGHLLAFYLFGKFGQVTHYVNETWTETFPVKSAHIEFQDSRFEIGDASLKDLKFLSSEDQLALATENYDALSLEEKRATLVRYKDQINQQPLFINLVANKYSLDYEARKEDSPSYSNLLDALDHFARYYISHQVFTQAKNNQLGQVNKEIRQLEKKVKSAKQTLQALNKASTYKGKADLLMANLWNIGKGVEEAVLTSFDGEQQVKISLKKNLTPQANAERYYRKSKNENKQRIYAQKHLEELEESLFIKQEELTRLEQIESLKEIRKKATTQEQSSQKRLPFREVQIGGYVLRIGKGAADNDELLRRYTSKNDLWFHAKDVSGSHVIMRNASNASIPDHVLEKVAGIAAFYSKAKSETLAAVMYTDVKFVRKVKGSPPGLVVVDKEKTILVEPVSAYE